MIKPVYNFIYIKRFLWIWLIVSCKDPSHKNKNVNKKYSDIKQETKQPNEGNSPVTSSNDRSAGGSAATGGGPGRSESSEALHIQLLELAKEPGTSVEQIKPLLQKGVDINKTDQSDHTVLMHAVKSRNESLVKELLEKGADPNIKGSYDWTALTLAVNCGYPEITNALLQKGADPDTADQEHVTALMDAAKNGHIDVVKLLLEAGADVNKIGSYRYTALIHATYSSHIKIVEALLQKGANVNAATCTLKEKDGSKTPLIIAINNRNLEMAKLLLEHNADPNQPDQMKTPLMHAVDQQYMDGIKLLLQYKKKLSEEIKLVLDNAKKDKSINKEIIDLLKSALDDQEVKQRT